jgi:predicted transcriptional regulator
MQTNLKLDQALADRLSSLAASRHQSPDAILSEALHQYLTREESAGAKKYPRRHLVGGIITPV